jgi:hypothetical protein
MIFCSNRTCENATLGSHAAPRSLFILRCVLGVGLLFLCIFWLGDRTRRMNRLPFEQYVRPPRLSSVRILAWLYGVKTHNGSSSKSDGNLVLRTAFARLSSGISPLPVSGEGRSVFNSTRPTSTGTYLSESGNCFVMSGFNWNAGAGGSPTQLRPILIASTRRVCQDKPLLYPRGGGSLE